jgi:hypothetical protein
MAFENPYLVIKLPRLAASSVALRLKVLASVFAAEDTENAKT